MTSSTPGPTPPCVLLEMSFMPHPPAPAHATEAGFSTGHSECIVLILLVTVYVITWPCGGGLHSEDGRRVTGTLQKQVVWTGVVVRGQDKQVLEQVEGQGTDIWVVCFREHHAIGLF
jgi:hypothetical protein